MFEAKPTEYYGIRFRSKCEAIFARAMHVCDAFVWEYEPEEWECAENGIWVPDFKIIRNVRGKRKVEIYAAEYKPSKPTATYKSELLKRFENIKAKLGGAIPHLIYGSPYSEDDQDILKIEGGEWDSTGIRPHEGIFEAMDRAMDYRFDLE